MPTTTVAPGSPCDMPPLHIHLLGPTSISATADFSDARVVPGRPQRTLLALLALRAGQIVAVDQLIEWLWAHRLPRDPRRTLHVRVSRLRTALGAHADALCTGQNSYRLAIDPRNVDGLRLLNASAAGHADALDESLLSWKGLPFADAEPITELTNARDRMETKLIEVTIASACTAERGNARALVERALEFVPYSDTLMRAFLEYSDSAEQRREAAARFVRWRGEYRTLFGSDPPTAVIAAADGLEPSGERASALAAGNILESDLLLVHCLAISETALRPADLTAITGGPSTRSALRLLQDRGLTSESRPGQWAVTQDGRALSRSTEAGYERAALLLDNWATPRGLPHIALRAKLVHADARSYLPQLLAEFVRLRDASDHATILALAEHAAELPAASPTEEAVRCLLIIARAHEHCGDEHAADEAYLKAISLAQRIDRIDLMVAGLTGSSALGRHGSDCPVHARLVTAIPWVRTHGTRNQLAAVLYELALREHSAMRRPPDDVVTELLTLTGGILPVPSEADSSAKTAPEKDEQCARGIVAHLMHEFSEPDIGARMGLTTTAIALATSPLTKFRGVHLHVEALLRTGRLESARLLLLRADVNALAREHPRSLWFLLCAEATIALLSGERDTWRQKCEQVSAVGTTYGFVDAAPTLVAHRIAGVLRGWPPEDTIEAVSGDFAEDGAVALMRAWVLHRTDPDRASELLRQHVPRLVRQTRQPLGRAGAHLAALCALRIGTKEVAPALAQWLHPHRGEITTVGTAVCAFGPADLARAAAHRLRGDFAAAARAERSARALCDAAHATHWSLPGGVPAMEWHPKMPNAL